MSDAVDLDRLRGLLTAVANSQHHVVADMVAVAIPHDVWTRIREEVQT